MDLAMRFGIKPRQASLVEAAQVISQPAAEPLLSAEAASQESPPAGKGLRRLVLQAAGWSMAGYLSGQVLRIASSLILTRLLVPEMFGVMAIAMMVQVVVGMLSDVGLRQAVIQSAEGDNQDFLDTAWTLQVIRGWVIWMVCVAVAAGIYWVNLHGWFPPSSVYAAPELPVIIAATAFTSAIAGFQSTKLISSQRHLNLGRVTAIELIAQVASLGVAIIFGWLTRSIWSFVISAWVAVLISTALSHAYLPGPANRFHIGREQARDLVRFGRWILLSSIFTVIAANGDRLMLAGWVSPATLGIYVLAYNLVALLDGAGGRLFAVVATPGLSKVARERPEHLRRAYYKFRLPFDLVFIGGAGALCGGSEAIIGILYDHRYADASHIIGVLSFSLLVARFGVVASVCLAVGEPQTQSLLNFLKTISIFVLLPLSYWAFGFEGALWAIALHGLATLPAIFAFKARHRLNSFSFELLVLLVWPVGYMAGLAATWGLEWMQGLV